MQTLAQQDRYHANCGPPGTPWGSFLVPRGSFGIPFGHPWHHFDTKGAQKGPKLKKGGKSELEYPPLKGPCWDHLNSFGVPLDDFGCTLGYKMKKKLVCEACAVPYHVFRRLSCKLRDRTCILYGIYRSDRIFAFSVNLTFRGRFGPPF